MQNWHKKVQIAQHIPVTDQRLQEIKQATANDSRMQHLITTIVTGWACKKLGVKSQAMKYDNTTMSERTW